jgi:ribose-phosphate pyrophosphokinase
MDLHAGQIQGFFSTPFDDLHSSPALLEAVMSLPRENLVVVSPDAGGVDRARFYSQKLNASLAVIDKRRSGPNQAEVMRLIGDVKDKIALMVDDMIDTAGTLTEGAKAVKEHGALEVRAMATHGVLSGPAHSRIENSPLTEVIVSDTIPPHTSNPKIRVVSVSQILSEAIERVHGSLSVSSMFYALQ